MVKKLVFIGMLLCTLSWGAKSQEVLKTDTVRRRWNRELVHQPFRRS